MLTKNHLTLILFVLQFIGLTSQAQLNAKTFQKQIYVAASEVRVDSLLKIFSRQTGAEFSFNSNKISPSMAIRVTRHSQTLSQWLTTLNNSLGIQHKVVGNHIILLDNDKSVSGKSIPNTSAAGTTTIAKSNLPNPPGKNEINQNSKTNLGVTPSSAIEQQQTERDDSFRSVDERIHENSGTSVLAVAGLDSSAKVPSAIPVNTTASAQADNGGSRNRSLQFFGGCSKHGSGDMIGMSFGGEYTQYFTKKLSLTYNFRATIHSGTASTTYTVGTDVYESSIRYTTAGFQLGANGGFSLVNSARHEFKINLGPFVRYQTESSGTNGYSTYSPIVTGVPGVLYDFFDSTKQETLSFGGILLLQYNYTFKNNLFLGAQTGFQTDTNGDAILHIGGLVIGKRF